MPCYAISSTVIMCDSAERETKIVFEVRTRGAVDVQYIARVFVGCRDQLVACLRQYLAGLEAVGTLCFAVRLPQVLGTAGICGCGFVGRMGGEGREGKVCGGMGRRRGSDCECLSCGGMA